MEEISICFLSGELLKLAYDPEEPCWKFCKRVGEKMGAFLDPDNKTIIYSLLQSPRGEINTFENRLLPMKELIIKDARICALEWTFKFEQSYKF